MSSQSSEEATKFQPALQGDRQGAGGTRNGCQLLCPIQSAHPNLRTGDKTCGNHCKDIRRVKYGRIHPSRVSQTHLTRECGREHLRKRHRCTCPGRPASCEILSHFGPQKLKKLKAIRHRHRETPGEQWVRIYRIVSPNQNEIPAPYVLSASDLRAIARSPLPSFVETLSESLQNTGDRDIDDIHLFLARVSHFIDLACQMGAYSNSQPAPRRVSAAQSPMQGSVAVEHQEDMNDESDWDNLINLSPDDTY